MRGRDMDKSVKGALAAGAAVLLTIGGGTTMATWTASEAVGGGAINSGSLDIVTDLVNLGCGDWSLDGLGGATTYTVGDPLVPGDVLTRECAFTIQAEGSHLTANVGLSLPSFSGADGDFLGNLVADVSQIRVGGAPTTTFTDANDGDTLTATITVEFDADAGNLTQNLSTVLSALTLTATQVHS